MYAPFHSSRAVCTPGRCSGAWSLLFYKKGTCLSRGFHQLFTKEWGEGGFCLPLPSPSFLPPIPPTPFPGGEGGAPKFISPGASPPAPLHLTACGTYSSCQAGARRGLARLVACQPCLWFTFLPPIPPTPFPGGEGGELRLFHARGFAPCIPATEPMVAAKKDRKRFPMSSAGSQGEGGPGERNYPSQATAAFEMVLSPGAGRASAAEGQAFPCGHRNRVANHAPRRGACLRRSGAG